MRKKRLSLFLQSGRESLWTTHLVAFVKINLLELGYIKEIDTICKNSLQKMSDKSSSDTFQEMTLFDTGAFVLFYLHLASILWYPQPPNSMLCRRCSLCSRRNKKKSTFLGGRGENVTETPKNRILLPSVSTLLSPIVLKQLFMLLWLPTWITVIRFYMDYLKFS